MLLTEVVQFADLVIYNKNPLQDISILEIPTEIDYCIKDGEIMVKQGKITYFS